MEHFKKLGLSERILKVIEEEKFELPSEIQEKAIPLVLQGKDIIGSAATGSGKTLAFGAGVVENTKKGEGIQALILTPTRELAEQNLHSLEKFSKYFDISMAAVYGGVSINPQIEALEKVEVVIGTPGRILDHLERGTLNLSKVKILVLDEADRMLDMGFIDDVNRIISYCPKDRQTLLFSATISPSIEVLAKKYMRNPEEIAVESYVDPSKLKQQFYDVPDYSKFSLLVHLLKQEHKGLVMIFANTRHIVSFLERNLRHNGIDAKAIHGGLSQRKRSDVMEQFHSNEVLVLICTDVAARGLDIKNVSHVYNYDIPPTADDYIHRIGRTARAGKEGLAVNIVASRDYESFQRINDIEAINIEKQELPEFEQVRTKMARINRRDDRNFRDRRKFGGGRSRGGFGGGNNYGDRDNRRSSYSNQNIHTGFIASENSERGEGRRPYKKRAGFHHRTPVDYNERPRKRRFY